MEPRSYQNPERWTPRTYADELNEQIGFRAVRTEPGGPGRPERARCACGREVPAFVLVDVRALPESVRGTQAWACDYCWTGWIRKRRISRPDWLRALGAPAALVERHEARGRPYAP